MTLISKVIAVVGLLTATTGVYALPIHLGSAGEYTLLSAGPGASQTSGFMQLGSKAIIHGNVGGRGFTSLGSGVEIHGKLIHGGYVSAAAGVNVSSGRENRNLSYWDLIYRDLLSASDSARLLSGTPLSSITSTTRLFGNGGLSVFNIDGSINLGSGESLTLSGNAADSFIINVSERLKLGSSAAILLDGVTADKVLFNFYGAGSDDAAWNNHLATIVGGAELSGTFIAPRAFWQIGDGAIMNATRVLANGIQGNLQTVRGIEHSVIFPPVNPPPVNLPPVNPPPINPPPVNVPEPTSLFLLAIGLFALFVSRRKFTG